MVITSSRAPTRMSNRRILAMAQKPSQSRTWPRLPLSCWNSQRLAGAESARVAGHCQLSSSAKPSRMRRISAGQRQLAWMHGSLATERRLHWRTNKRAFYSRPMRSCQRHPSPFSVPGPFPMSLSDSSQRFLFDDTDIRGELVSLQDSYAHVLAKHDYPAPVAELLGELLAAAALLVSTLKFDGLLVLQARSSGPVPLLMAECSSDRHLRAIAHYEAEQITPHASFQELMPDGVLAVTVDPARGQRYQGIVPLEGDSLSACLSDYFASSEQLPTRFWLHADGRRARGLLLQQLPAHAQPDPEERAASWQHMTVLADSLTAEEQMGLDN